MYKKYDILIYFSILICLTGLFVLSETKDKSKPDKIEIYLDNKLTYRYNITDAEKIYSVNGKDGRIKIDVRGGTVRVLESPCRNKLCVKQGAVSQNGDVLVCLPEKMVIKLTGAENEVDGVLK